MIQAEFHPEMFLVLPTVAITKGDCADPACAAVHWRVSVGWFVGSLHFCF
ncbi:MAG TPA: hypothetical protein VNN22_24240 [Verrucomicrobiae bacterium]|nr:hypothetical protein [Verrucomicrobiae bacterium]